jgi:ATPase associated with various cellular activities AAA_5
VFDKGEIVMSILTLDSKLVDIKTLLKNEDICFKKTIKKTFEEVSKDEEQKNAFCFFMAMALGGVGTDFDKENNVKETNEIQREFLDITGIAKTDKNEWSKCVFNFVCLSKGLFGEKYNNYLSKANDISLKEIYEKGIKDLKYTDEKDGKVEVDYVFGKGKGWWFTYEKTGEKKLRNPDGEIPERVDKGIRAIIDCLIKQFNKEYTIEKTPQYNLLLANKQLIMNGAPGTGKTYSARNIIADILFDTLCESENKKEEIKKVRLDMVQFHPSYDYTDFMDGIRPDLSCNELNYSLKNGPFKSFCRRAGVIERIYAAGKPVESDVFDKFLSGEDESIKNFWKAEIEKERLKQEIEKVNEKVNKSLDITEFDTSKLPSFLFIIDEINRAEISKVFGEIMYCLDPDYRGVKGAISTQYSELATDNTFFINKDNDKFFIPSNVYIIGTMNDIDRSVEVFDFALRRRFAWYEVKADEVMDDILKSMEVDTLLDQNYEDYKAKIDALNNAIVDALKLNKHYHLGPSYFAKINLYYDETKKNYEEAKEKVWNNHISQILNEYVKGRGKENEVEGIGKAFISIQD